MPCHVTSCPSHYLTQNSYWGGTADELWSSPDALKECTDPTAPLPAADSTLWNGMISPLLNTTVTG